MVNVHAIARKKEICTSKVFYYILLNGSVDAPIKNALTTALEWSQNNWFYSWWVDWLYHKKYGFPQIFLISFSISHHWSKTIGFIQLVSFMYAWWETTINKEGIILILISFIIITFYLFRIGILNYYLGLIGSKPRILFSSTRNSAWNVAYF